MPARRALLALSALLALPDGPAAAEEMRRPLSWQQRRFRHVVRQVLEFSCGSASLATILTYFLGRPTGEADVIAVLRERYPTREAWRERAETGFSLGDLIFAAERLGFAAQAARVPLEQLGRVAGPLVVHLDKGRWQHFSVLRASHEGVFYLADPMVGQTSMLEGGFRREYTGAALAVWRRGEALPTRSPLQVIRDGISVERTLADAVRAVGLMPRGDFALPF
ncbi:MAG: C39 family peptidase [Roseococcus sp.]